MNKIIEINPALFTAGGVSKTKTIKNKSIKNKPIINPSVLKNKFLKRIKQHKTNEIKDTYKNTNVQPVTNTDLFTDEFSQSIEYLQKLSREKHKNADNQHKKDCLEKKTVKNYNSIYNTFPKVNQTNINIELPTELKEDRYVMPNDTNKINIVNPIITNNTPQVIPIHINPPIPKAPLQIYNDMQRDMLKVSNKPALPNHADMPYGILKGGNKPTYRAWNKTQKNNMPSGGLTSNIIDNKELSMREDKLNKLKNKIQERHANVSSNEPTDRWMTSNFISNRKNGGITTPPIPPNNTQQQLKLSKKTITKRYTLGKSKIKRQIGVLIKNRETRKKVISAHKELKQQPICDIKTYLNEHNLIKIGSKAPTDVMRKLYETAKLSGDIYNLNNDTLLHNLKKSDDNH